jgi:hypothetical protein
MCSPANIASRRLSTRARGPARRADQRLVGEPVLGEVEVEAGAVGDEALAALRVGGEEVAQMVSRSSAKCAPAPARQARWRSPGHRSRARPDLRLDRLQHLVPRLGEARLALLLQPLGEASTSTPARWNRASTSSESPPSAGTTLPTSPWSAKACRSAPASC